MYFPRASPTPTSPPPHPPSLTITQQHETALLSQPAMRTHEMHRTCPSSDAQPPKTSAIVPAGRSAAPTSHSNFTIRSSSKNSRHGAASRSGCELALMTRMPPPPDAEKSSPSALLREHCRSSARSKASIVSRSSWACDLRRREAAASGLTSAAKLRSPKVPMRFLYLLCSRVCFVCFHRRRARLFIQRGQRGQGISTIQADGIS